MRIRLFGGLEVRRDGELLPGFPTERAKSLFAFLVLHRDRLFRRDVLCGRLWGDQTQSNARKTLRTALWRIRSMLEPGEEDEGRVVHVEGRKIGIPGTASVWVDAWEFEERTEDACGAMEDELDADGARCCVRAASLYRGDLLEGIYREWCTFHRERFRLAHLTCLERLVTYLRRRDEWLKAITWGRRLLRRDPLREHVHRALMACHFARGDRPSALRRYERCAEVLDEELGIDPMPETRRLRERILEADAGRVEEPDDGRDADPAAVRPPPIRRRRLRSMAREVEGALEELYALTERLERAHEALRVDAGQERDGSGGGRAGRASPGH